MGQVHGKIVFEGKPVPAGSVMFAPVSEEFEAGRPATGTPNASGEFQLSTYKLNDGALVGPHRVIYSPPPFPEVSDPVKRAAELQLHRRFGRCRLPQDHVVEVKPGRNEITLELQRYVPPPQ
jgi:hypothetical protein